MQPMRTKLKFIRHALRPKKNTILGPNLNCPDSDLELHSFSDRGGSFYHWAWTSGLSSAVEHNKTLGWV